MVAEQLHPPRHSSSRKVPLSPFATDTRKRRFVAADGDGYVHKELGDALDAPVVLQRWSAAAAHGSPVTRTTTSGFAGFAGATSSFSSFASSSSNKTPRDPDDNGGLGEGANAKRLRASPFAPVVGVNNGSGKGNRDALPFMSAARSSSVLREGKSSDGLLGPDYMTPEEQYQAMKEGSQNLMEVLSISQQNTQECTQTLEESPNMCVMRLVLHPEVDRAITAYQKNDLEKHDLYRIEIHRQRSIVKLGRDSYVNIFDKKSSGIDPIKLSRVHCVVECITDPNTHTVGVYITDKSTNGIRIDGIQLQKEKKHKLQDGQKITLLSSRQGNVLLGYVVEDPHVRGAQVAADHDSSKNHGGLRMLDSQDKSQQGRDFQEYTLGVLFSSPLVGKDIQGKYHPIAELDVKREYSILKQSLIEASKYAKRPIANSTSAMATTTAGSKLYQYPRQINVCAKFANTENFRTIVTIGCRALHFSGHGDEKHLYFEDGMGLVHPIPHSSLQELFSAGGSDSGESTLRLAFVSACSSAPLAYAFVACGIPHVIGVRTNQKIEDYAAIEFTRSFYLALATGKSVGASFTIAQQAVAKSPNIRGPMEVAEKFLLLPEGGDHSEIIFPLAAVEAGKTMELGPLKLKKYPKLWFDDLPAICQGFCNRSIEVYKICLALMLTQSRITRLVTICGEEGIGKTAVAHAVANYVGPRITSEGGVRIFSITKLAQDEKDDQQSMIRRHIDIKSAKCRVLGKLESLIKDHLAQHKARVEFHAQQLLLVLDGCDYLLQSDVRRNRFRVFLSDLLTNNASLKIVLTARTSISTDGAVAGHGERVYTLSRFSAKMAAKMLLSLVSRPIRVEELKRARPPVPAASATPVAGCNGTPPVDKVELIASHPALLATLGIPKRVADLAGRLNECIMDNILVDESNGANGGMMMD
uniref:FHA domain-containing protein n=1 Tax=Globisporangium ultimum (strain ATCC 200006 / CBS 805.95 / DAOM BR144) TaxID=431595 RepID=K3WVI5_GLOUD